jgi:phytanoyl-CoA hydroxylase
VPRALTLGQLRTWRREGYLVIEGFFSDEEIDTVNAAAERVWDERPSYVTVDDLDLGLRQRACQVTDDQRRHRFKVNDLYLTDPSLRDVAGSKKVGGVLADLLRDEPVMINTLNMTQGSEQADHLDTLFMCPPRPPAMAVTWMALEDVRADAGPLRYYPGSHRIRPYVFETGSLNLNQLELPRWQEYMDRELARNRMEEQRFLANKGDLFVWHSLLLHGGCPIASRGTTRRSLVTHFHTRHDYRAAESSLLPVDAGWWLVRPPQPVPGFDDAKPTRPPTSEPQDMAVPQRPRPRGLGWWGRLRAG